MNNRRLSRHVEKCAIEVVKYALISKSISGIGTRLGQRWHVGKRMFAIFVVQNSNLSLWLEICKKVVVL
jgi:hypothetical protein